MCVVPHIYHPLPSLILSSFFSLKCTSYSTQSCSQAITWSVVTPNSSDSSSLCQPYTGTTCSSLLSTWQTCAIGMSDGVFIKSSPSLEANVQLVNTLLTTLQSTGVSESCQTAGAIFLCQYYFPLCHCQTGEQYLPSRETCLYVSTDVCHSEWEVAMAVDPNNVPDCLLLPLLSKLPHSLSLSSKLNQTYRFWWFWNWRYESSYDR